MVWRQVAVARRLLASERGALVRDWGGRVPIVLAYPNSYAVGMSSLAMHALYALFNALPGVVCERAFSWLGSDRDETGPLIALESQRPASAAAVLAFSVSHEMDYFHVVEMLRRVPVATRAAERREGDPIVLMGGPAVSANPEPMAPLADAVFVGEVEPALPSLGAALGGAPSLDRQGLIQALGTVPGMYVPALHRGQQVARQWLADLDAYPTHTTVAVPRAEFGDMFLMEVSRGCPHRCRFCLACALYAPPRQRSVQGLLEQARTGLGVSRKVGLVGAAVSDHSEIDALVGGLRQMGAAISVSSLRIRPLSEALVAALADSGARSITLAPEAGSERLRREIRKGVTHDDVLRAVEALGDRFASLKLYFMIGLPSETDADVDELVALVGEVAGLHRREVVVSVTPFVPKAHTPYEREAMATRGELASRLRRIKAGCRRLDGGRVRVRSESVEDSIVQAMLARGDRAVGEVLAGMNPPAPDLFAAALHGAGVDAEALLGSRPAASPLPWDFIALQSRAR